jgi:hypothetical protein
MDGAPIGHGARRTLPATSGTPLASARPVAGCGTYQPRVAETGALHTLVRTHLEDFLRAAADRNDGVGVPRFVEAEFRDFLGCGVCAARAASSSA